MSDIFKNEARRLAKLGAFSTEELSEVLQAYSKKDESILEAIAEGESAQQKLLDDYARNRMYKHMRRISNNVAFFFWVTIISALLWIILLLFNS